MRNADHRGISMADVLVLMLVCAVLFGYATDVVHKAKSVSLREKCASKRNSICE